MRRLFALCGLLVAVAGCSKIKDAANISFSIPYETTVPLTDVPGSPTADSLIPLPQPVPYNLPAFAIATSNESVFKQNNTTADKIVSAKLGQLSMSINQPANGTFNFLNEVRVYMSGDKMSEVLVAQKVPVPKNVNVVEMDLQDVELKTLLQGDSIRIRIAAVFNALPPANSVLGLKSSFKLTANPLQ